MTKNNFCRLLTLSLLFIFCGLAHARGQVLQINTHFNSLLGKPSWLLIVRDVETGKVLPYLYDICDNDNFWIALTEGRSYRVTASELKFGPFAKVKNFCNLENGVISAQSMFITIRGDMTPDSNRIICRVMKYKDTQSWN